MRFYIFIDLFNRLGYSTLVYSSMVILNKKKFPIEILVSVNGGLILICLVFSFILGKYLKVNKEMNWFWAFYIAIFISNIFSFINILIFDGSNIKLVTILCIIEGIFTKSFSSGKFVVEGAFRNKISDENYGSSFLAVVNSFGNLGFMWCETFTLFLINYFDFRIIIVIGWIYGIIFIFIFFRKVLDLQILSKRNYRL